MNLTGHDNNHTMGRWIFNNWWRTKYSYDGSSTIIDTRIENVP